MNEESLDCVVLWNFILQNTVPPESLVQVLESLGRRGLEAVQEQDCNCFKLSGSMDNLILTSQDEDIEFVEFDELGKEDERNEDEQDEDEDDDDDVLYKICLL